MAKQRYIDTHFWDDTFIIDLDSIEKLLFLYLLTNPLTTICGAYEINIRRIAFDTGIDKDMVLKILNRFEESDKVIYQNGWVLVPNFIKNQSGAPKIQKGIENALSGCPNWIKDTLYIRYERLSYLNLNLNTNPNLNLNTNTKQAKNQPAEKPVSENYANEKISLFTEEVFNELRAEMKVNTLPHETEWLRTFEWAFENEFTKHQVLECYRLLKDQDWRTGRISAKTVMNNLPNLENLKNGNKRRNDKADRDAERSDRQDEIIERLKRGGGAEEADTKLLGDSNGIN